MPKVLITGITGQDGSYLAEEYLSFGWEVHGIVRRTSIISRPRIDHLFNKSEEAGRQQLKLHYGDLNDLSAVVRIIDKVKPDHVVNLGAQSHVAVSFEVPIETSLVTGVGAAALFEAVRIVNKEIRIYQASSSEMFGTSVDEDGYQRESTPMNPVSPYGCAKVFGYNISRHYREAYGLHITNGILFNHESPRRGSNFVTNKVVKTAVQIKLGQKSLLEMGNLDSFRDWGHSADYVRAMHAIVNAEIPSDYVVATGTTHSVRELCEYVFMQLDLDYNNYVVQNPKFLRPQELKYLKGDATRIKAELGWKPLYTFEALLDEMIQHWQELLS